MGKITTGTENVMLFAKYNVLVVSFFFAIACTICESADGLEFIS